MIVLRADAEHVTPWLLLVGMLRRLLSSPLTRVPPGLRVCVARPPELRVICPPFWKPPVPGLPPMTLPCLH